MFILLRESALVYDPTKTSQNAEQYIVEVIGKEIKKNLIKI